MYEKNFIFTACYEYGTVYFKNDSGYLMAFGSAVEKLRLPPYPNGLSTSQEKSLTLLAW